MVWEYQIISQWSPQKDGWLMVTGDLFKPERYTFASEWVRYITPMSLARTIFSPPLSLSLFLSLRLLKFKICIRSTCENLKSTNWAVRPRTLFYSCIIVNWSHRFGFCFRGPLSLCLSSQYYSTCPAPPLCNPFLSFPFARNKFVFCKCSEFFRSSNCENSERRKAIYMKVTRNALY